MQPETPSATAFGPRFASLARESPTAPAVTCGDSSLSRQELNIRTNRLARAFMARGAKPDTCITIALPNGIAFIEAMIAAWKIGATPQPVSARLPKVELEAIVELAAPSLLVDENCDFGQLERWSGDPLPPAVAA